MSIEYIEGFDHIAAADMAVKWDAGNDSFSCSITTGRFAGSALAVTGGASNHYGKQTKTLPGGSLATRVMGMAFKAGIKDDRAICGFSDNGSLQIEVRTTAAGYFTVTRNATVLATSTFAYQTNTWYYIEFSATINSSTGAYELRVDGTNILSASGVNTQNTANASANQIFVAHASNANSTTYLYDDLYVASAFQGECRVLTNLPTGDSGTNKQWSRSTGSNNYALVDEATQNGDTDYVYSATVGQIDTYTFASITPPGGILAVQTNLCARKDDAGTRTLIEQCRSGGTNYNGSRTHTLNSAYDVFHEIRETDPNTGLAWAAAGVNAAEFGVKVTA